MKNFPMVMDKINEISCSAQNDFAVMLNGVKHLNFEEFVIPEH